MRAIEQQNRPSNATVIQRSIHELGRLKLSDCQHNIREYIQQANTHLINITNASGIYTSSQVVTAPLNRPPYRFNTFRELTLYNKDLDSYTSADYIGFTKRLIAFVDENKER